jgi:sterol desaturase/sphingolipid hydroxylase (fatty acid hydroxylase superfamily)
VIESLFTRPGLSEAAIRLAVFLGIFCIVAVWELSASRRRLEHKKSSRWIANLSIVAIGALLVRAAGPLMPVAVAAVARDRHWGLINYFELPAWIGIIAALIVLDCAIYLQHVMFHTLPLLWRIHLVHHADLDIDTTTGLRFHPIEIIISMFIKVFVVLLLGADPIAVIIFESVLNGTSLFNHGNVRIPRGFDRVLRLLVVTPDMHRVHHSVVIRETNSNFGFNFPWWDRLFGTYRDQPQAGHEGMTIGLSQYRRFMPHYLRWALILPFIADAGAYAINRRGREPGGSR